MSRTMIRSLATVLILAFGLLALGACSSTQTAGEQVDDAAIVTKIKTKLTADTARQPASPAHTKILFNIRGLLWKICG